MSNLSEEEIRHLRELILNNSEAIRDLLDVAEDVHNEAKYRQARRLIFKSYKQTVIVIAGIVAAMAATWDELRDLAVWLATRGP